MFRAAFSNAARSRLENPRPRTPGSTNIRFTSPTSDSSGRIAPQATGRPARRPIRNTLRGTVRSSRRKWPDPSSTQSYRRASSVDSSAINLAASVEAASSGAISNWSVGGTGISSCVASGWSRPDRQIIPAGNPAGSWMPQGAPPAQALLTAPLACNSFSSMLRCRYPPRETACRR